VSVQAACGQTSKIETIAENHFSDQMIGRGGEADAQAEIDFPFGRQIQVEGGKNLLLLLPCGQEIRGWPDGTVIFDTSSDLLRKVVADFYVGRKDKTLAHRLAVKGTIEGGVEIEIPAPELLIDDGAHLPGPSVGGELAALVADFIGKAEADRPFPFLWDGDTWTNVVADPLNALAATLGSKNVKTNFEPVCETMGDLDGFVFSMVCGIEAVDDSFGAVDGEITVELNHGVAGINQIGTVDLNFVIVLSARWHTHREKQTAR
jgi:hypothetical protein